MASLRSTIDAILARNFDLDKRRFVFFGHCLCLFLRVLGRLNFLQMSRQGGSTYVETTYRNNFDTFFDFATFNTALIQTYGSGHYILALDMTHIAKSGRSTYGLGKYWSGCDSSAKWGLEAGILAVVDVDNHTALSIDAIQTPPKSERETLGISYVSHCLDILRWNQDQLLKLSSYIVLDSYFCKKSFIVPLLEKTPFQLVSRLRKDANLRYLYQGKASSGRGRPRKYSGKVGWKNLDNGYWKTLEENEAYCLREAVLYAVFLKRKVKVVCQTYKKKQNKHKIYFSTDTALEGLKIKAYYQLRFQEEFLIRDAKQFTGLTHCQARGQNKMEFHWNMSLTAVNLVKATQWLNIPKEKRTPFSMSDAKIRAHNQFFAEFIFKQLGVDDKGIKNNIKMKEIINFGVKHHNF